MAKNEPAEISPELTILVPGDAERENTSERAVDAARVHDQVVAARAHGKNGDADAVRGVAPDGPTIVDDNIATRAGCDGGDSNAVVQALPGRGHGPAVGDGDRAIGAEGKASNTDCARFDIAGIVDIDRAALPKSLHIDANHGIDRPAIFDADRTVCTAARGINADGIGAAR
jgi:hypothetical protein